MGGRERGTRAAFSQMYRYKLAFLCLAYIVRVDRGDLSPRTCRAPRTLEDGVCSPPALRAAGGLSTTLKYRLPRALPLFPFIAASGETRHGGSAPRGLAPRPGPPSYTCFFTTRDGLRRHLASLAETHISHGSVIAHTGTPRRARGRSTERPGRSGAPPPRDRWGAARAGRGTESGRARGDAASMYHPPHLLVLVINLPNPFKLQNQAAHARATVFAHGKQVS